MTNLTNLKKIGVSLLALSLLIPMVINSVNSVYAQKVTINGAGATFPFPLIDTWRSTISKS